MYRLCLIQPMKEADFCFRDIVIDYYNYPLTSLRVVYRLCLIQLFDARLLYK